MSLLGGTCRNKPRLSNQVFIRKMGHLVLPRDPVVPSKKVQLDPPNLHNSVSNHRTSEGTTGSLGLVHVRIYIGTYIMNWRLQVVPDVSPGASGVAPTPMRPSPVTRAARRATPPRPAPRRARAHRSRAWAPCRAFGFERRRPGRVGLVSDKLVFLAAGRERIP